MPNKIFEVHPLELYSYEVKNKLHIRNIKQLRASF